MKRFYKQMVSDFVPHVVSYSAANTFWNDTGMAMESLLFGGVAMLFVVHRPAEHHRLKDERWPPQKL